MQRRATLFLLSIAALGLPTLRSLAPSRPIPSAAASFGHGPEIVLVHGLGARSEQWLATARLLSRDHRVTLVDLPGHGESAMPRPFSLDAAAASLDVTLAAGGGEPVVLVGHSLGGLVCAAEALAHPGRVRGLVLVETALCPQLPAELRPSLLAELDAHYADLVHAAYLDFGRDSLQGEALWREVEPLDPGMMKRWIRLAWSADLSAAAEGLRVPVLAVLAPRSWEDGEGRPAVVRALGYERVPRLRLARLDGCGHFVMLDRPGDLAGLIAQFSTDPEGNAQLAARR